MMRTTLLAAMSLLWLVSCAPPTAKISSPRIDALIAQMGGPQFRQRAAAQNELVAIGEPAVPALALAAHQSANPEIRDRADIALQHIRDTSPGTPTAVSLHLVNADMDTVCQLLSDQARVPIQCENKYRVMDYGKEIHLTLNLERVPFWLAMQQICDKGQLYVEPPAFNFDPAIIRLDQASDDDKAFWDQHGTYAVKIQTRTTGGERTLSGLEVALLADPKLHLLDCQLTSPLVAQDERGASVLWNNRTFGSEPPVSWYWHRGAMIFTSPSSGKYLDTVTGTLGAQFATGIARVTIPDLAAAVGTSKTAGGWQITAVHFKSLADHAPVQQAFVQLFATRVGPTPIRSGDFDGLFRAFQCARITDATGHPLAAHVMGTTVGDRRLDWIATISAPDHHPLAGPISFEWDLPTEIQTVTIPFRFTHLAVPLTEHDEGNP